MNRQWEQKEKDKDYTKGSLKITGDRHGLNTQRDATW